MTLTVYLSQKSHSFFGRDVIPVVYISSTRWISNKLCAVWSFDQAGNTKTCCGYWKLANNRSDAVENHWPVDGKTCQFSWFVQSPICHTLSWCIYSFKILGFSSTLDNCWISRVIIPQYGWDISSNNKSDISSSTSTIRLMEPRLGSIRSRWWPIYLSLFTFFIWNLSGQSDEDGRQRWLTVVN